VWAAIIRKRTKKKYRRSLEDTVQMIVCGVSPEEEESETGRLKPGVTE